MPCHVLEHYLQAAFACPYHSTFYYTGDRARVSWDGELLQCAISLYLAADVSMATMLIGLANSDKMCCN